MKEIERYRDSMRERREDIKNKKTNGIHVQQNTIFSGKKKAERNTVQEYKLFLILNYLRISILETFPMAR